MRDLTNNDLEYARALIAARAPELTGADLEALALAHPAVGVSVEIMDALLEAVDAVEERMSALEAAMKNFIHLTGGQALTGETRETERLSAQTPVRGLALPLDLVKYMALLKKYWRL